MPLYGPLPAGATCLSNQICEWPAPPLSKSAGKIRLFSPLSDKICIHFKLYCSRERGREVYYEIYIDSLLLLNFVMNLYCLELVNLILLRTATRTRVILGAALGAVMYLLPFLFPGAGWIKTAVFFPLSVVIMILTTFRPIHIKAFFRVARMLLVVSFLLGGGLLCLLRLVPEGGIWMRGILGVMVPGALVFMEVSHMIQRRTQSHLCKVEIIGKGARITVNALIDTGNSLVEPVSGKPVCILEKSIFEGLWRSGSPEGFRVIPYYSVGKKRGILYGYLVPEIRINNNGLMKSCKNIYVGIVEGEIARSGGYCMILNPMILYAGQKYGSEQKSGKPELEV